MYVITSTGHLALIHTLLGFSLALNVMLFIHLRRRSASNGSSDLPGSRSNLQQPTSTLDASQQQNEAKHG